jgi:protein-tyrosine kinase
MDAEVTRIKDMSDADRHLSRSIGAILVRQGRLAPAEVVQIQRFAEENQMRFGDAARRLNILTQQDIDLAVAQQFNYPIIARGGDGGVSDEVVAAYNPQSELVEPLRALRSQLMIRWLSPNTEKHRALTIISSERGEGRSWITANLAVVLAQGGFRTLIIDTDLRHPRQHQLFNLPNSIGLSALLTGRAGKEIVQKLHPHLRLYILTAGHLPPNPQELLGRPVFDLVLSAFAEQYEIVLLDSPATSDTADGQLLASMAGAAIIVTRLHHTKVTGLLATVQNLTQSGVNVMGSVVNEC